MWSKLNVKCVPETWRVKGVAVPGRIPGFSSRWKIISLFMQSLMVMVKQAGHVGICRNGARFRVQQGATTKEQGPKEGPIWVKSDEWQDLTDNTYRVYCHALHRGGLTTPVVMDTSPNCFFLLGWLYECWSSQCTIALKGSGNELFFANFARILYAMHRSWGVSLRQRPATQDYAAGALRREGRNSWWFTLIYILVESWFARFWKSWILPFFLSLPLLVTHHTERKSHHDPMNTRMIASRRAQSLGRSCSRQQGDEFQGPKGQRFGEAVEAIEARIPSEKCKSSSRRRIPSRQCAPICLALRVNDWRIEVDFKLTWHSDYRWL